MESAQVLKYIQESRKSIYFVAAFLGAVLVSIPFAVLAAPPTWTGPEFTLTTTGQGKSVNAVNHVNNTLFWGNSSAIGYNNGTSLYNWVGLGSNDTFYLLAGNDTTQLAATSFANATFIINGTGGGNSTFSLISGTHSNFTIIEGNLVGNEYNATQAFVITGGANSTVNETTYKFGTTGLNAVGNAFYSINLGTNSTVFLASDFQGNATVFNVIF